MKNLVIAKLLVLYQQSIAFFSNDDHSEPYAKERWEYLEKYCF